MTVYGDRIKAARKTMGWTQKELADHAGTTQQTIQRYESGQSEPQSTNIMALSQALGVTVSYLLGFDDDGLNDKGLSKDEQRLIELYRSTDARGRAAIMAIAESQRGAGCFQSLEKAI